MKDYIKLATWRANAGAAFLDEKFPYWTEKLMKKS